MLDLNYISKLLEAILMATLPVLAGAGVRWLVAQYDVQRAKLSQETQFWLNFAANVAVQAAEQLYAQNDGAAKKAYAIQVVQGQLDTTGLKIDVAAIEAAIEAAVFSQNVPVPEVG